MGKKLAGRAEREEEVRELQRRLADPNDPYDASHDHEEGDDG